MWSGPARVLACLSVLLAAAPVPDSMAAPPVRDGIAFDAYSPLATATEITRRTQTPITFDRLQRYREASGQRVDERMLDLAAESFDVYLPTGAPRDRYGLLVWVSPHEVMPTPRDWRDALDEHGIILVAARRSGNDQGTLERRLPLALHAAHNLAARYPVDPARIYAGGFSGGSRAALRLAVDFPDLFRGALLNAGSDVLGGEAMTVPDASLLQLLQERSRLVYVTGARDLPNRRMDAASQASMEAFCIAGVVNVPMPRVEHAPPDRRSFARALAALDPPTDAAANVARDPTGLAECRRRLEEQVRTALAEVDALLAAGRLDDAGNRLGEIDLHWGGLAAPRTVALARRLAASRHDAQGPADDE